MQDRYAFYCGAAKVREGKSLPAGGVVQLKSLGQLEEFFEAQGAGKEFCRVCRMLLNAGVSGVYAVPLTVDGSQAGEELYEGALRKLCEIKRGGVILCDSTKPEVLHKLKEQVSWLRRMSGSGWRSAVLQRSRRRRQQNHSTVNGWCSAARKQG